jgi:DNA-directed RNA polymerase subunit H
MELKYTSQNRKFFFKWIFIVIVSLRSDFLFGGYNLVKEKPKVDILEHEIVPKHKILTKEETDELLKKYSIKLLNLPRIFSDDPVVEMIGARYGDVIRIIRKSETTVKEVESYRFVMKGKRVR